MRLRRGDSRCAAEIAAGGCGDGGGGSSSFEFEFERGPGGQFELSPSDSSSLEFEFERGEKFERSPSDSSSFEFEFEKEEEVRVESSSSRVSSLRLRRLRPEAVEIAALRRRWKTGAPIAASAGAKGERFELRVRVREKSAFGVEITACGRGDCR